jgi:autotransporter-associated beta strand protein
MWGSNFKSSFCNFWKNFYTCPQLAALTMKATKERFSRFHLLRLRRQCTTLLLVNLFLKTICGNRRIKSRRPVRVLAALLAWLSLGPFAAYATDFFWHTPSGGDWGFNGNWSGGPHPETFSDTASFNEAGSPPPAPVTLISVQTPPPVPTIGTLNLNVGGFTFQNGTLQLGGATTINVQSHNPFADFAASATIQLFSNATISTSLANSTLSVAGGITGAFGLTKTGPGNLTLSGTNTYTGNTAVTAGTLLVNGSLGAGSVNVSSGATLGGTGTIGGPVTIQNGGILSPGASPVPGTLTTGSLTLNSGSILNYKFGIPNVVNSGVNDLVTVMGNLTLAGTLNVTDAGGFGAGVYRVFNYSGSLTNNTLNLGSLPSGFGLSVDTAHANQVNLVVSGGLPTQFWDGSNTTPGSIAFGRGGNGTWNNVPTNTNWTTQDGTHNAAWGNGFAIFAGTAGTVTLGDNIHFTGMQFLTDGYLVEAPGSQTLLAAPDTKIRTDVGVTATISAPIANDSNPAKLTKADAGTLVLVGNNTYTGGTTIEAGTLQLGNGGMTGSVMGDIVDDGVLAISRSDLITLAGVISGTGSLTQLGPGTLVLAGGNTYTGTTTMSGGILSIASGANLGATSSLTFNGGNLLTTGNVTTSLPVILAANGTIDNSGNTDTFSGVLSGAGALTSTGAGTLILIATNTYSGGTTIAAGTLELGNGGTSGSVVGNITDNAALVFNRSDEVTYGGIVSGSGSLAQFGTGTLTLSGMNTYIGGTFLNEGVIAVAFDHALGDPNGRLAFNGGTLRFDAQFDLSTTRPIKLESGGGTIDTQSFITTMSQEITGSGTLTKAGTGTLALIGDNTYSGGTTISGGTLQLGNGGTSGSIIGNVADNGVLAFNRSDSVTFGGVISGTGSLVKHGAGTLTLPAKNTYAGTTTIDAGSLIVDGSIASEQTFVNAGAFLGGHGTIGGNLSNSGTVGPGDSLGTLTVASDYTQNAAGTLRIQVGGLAANQHDLLAVNGHVTLGGTLQLLRLGGFNLQPGNQIVFLTAQKGISGAFNTIQNDFTTGTIVQGVVVTSSDTVVLEGQQGSFTQIPGVTLTPNQVAVGNMLNSAVGNPAAAPLIAFLNSQPVANLPHDYNLIAPTQISSVNATAVSVGNVQMSNLGGRLANIRAGSTGFSSAGFAISGGAASFREGLAGVSGPEGKSGLPVFAPIPSNRWGVFVTGLGEFTNVDSTPNAPGYDVNTGGFTLGVDYRLTPIFAIGLTAGYAHTSVAIASPGGNVDVNAGKIGMYATLFRKGFYLDTAVSGGPSGYTTRRTALQGTANGSTNGGDLDALVAVGYDWQKGNLTIGPTASFQYGYVGLNGFTETGSLAPLKFPDQNTESERAAFGAKAFYNWKIGSITAIPQFSAAWQHEFESTEYSVVASLASGAGNSFTVFGPPIGRDSLLIGAGATVILNERVSTYIYYDGEFARTKYLSNNVSGGVRISF